MTELKPDQERKKDSGKRKKPQNSPGACNVKGLRNPPPHEANTARRPRRWPQLWQICLTKRVKIKSVKPFKVSNAVEID